MRQSSFLVLALALAVCGSAHAQTSALDAEIQAKVGKDYWLTGVVSFCEPNILVANCTILSGSLFAPKHLKIDDIETRGIIGHVDYYHVTLDDGRTANIKALDVLANGTDVDPIKEAEKAAAECKRRGDPRIGMTAKQVEATCWGKPDHVNRTQTAAGISDQYVYGDGRYVYLHNGIVTSIQATGTLC